MAPGTPTISVIVPSYRGGPALTRCLASLLEQDDAPPFEVILVRSGVGRSGDSNSEVVDGGPVPEDPRLRVFDHRRRLSAAAARNIAVRYAAGDVLVFTDADAVAAPHWLRALVHRSEGNTCCVAGAIVNGTPKSAVGTAEYLVAFLDLHPRRPPATVWHGATCNLLLPVDLWRRYGPFPEDMGGGEDTVLCARLHQEGLLRFAPAATVAHLNRTRHLDVLVHQYHYGRFSRLVAARGPYKMRPLVRYRILAPVAGVLRVASVAARALAWARLPPGLALRAAPVVVSSISAWTVGLGTGPRHAGKTPVPARYVAGSGEIRR